MSSEIVASAEDPRVSKIRRFSADRIATVLARTEGQRDIERLLAIGESCPYSSIRECIAIWLEEFRRLWSERSGSRQAERAA